MKVMMTGTLRGAAIALALMVMPLAADAGPRVNTNDANVAIEGYDPVAYHTVGQPMQGNPAFSHEWHDATWQFASAENRDLFAANPDRYAPQFGGFCSGALSKGIVATIDPNEWVILEGQLFLGGRPGATQYLRDGDRDRLAQAAANFETHLASD